MDDIIEKLKALNRTELLMNMAAELPAIRDELGLSVEVIADRTGIDKNKLIDVEAGKKNLNWSEYLSILFLFWSNDSSRRLIEEKGLFPETLKEILSVNRNIHPYGS